MLLSDSVVVDTFATSSSADEGTVVDFLLIDTDIAIFLCKMEALSAPTVD